MTESLPQRPFALQMYADSDHLIGARWWQESLHRLPPDGISRRRALLALALTLGPAAAAGGFLAWLTKESDEVEITMDALELQRREGWNVGHPRATLAFPFSSAVDIDGSAGWRDALTNLPLELAPAQISLAPFYVPTLFQSPAALGGASLRAALTPVLPTTDDRDLHRGEAIRSLFSDPETPQDIGIILDLSGPSSVAVAAGMAAGFDPVFVFDNWPHPLGVVPSHLTLGAVLYYRARFLRLRAARTGRNPPVFVLDRNRLAHYTDEESQFDNRYVARLPTASNFQSLGIRRLLYITPDESEMRELDDLNEDFVAFRNASMDVKVMPLSDLKRETRPGARPSAYYYGGHPHTHVYFWHTYRWLGSSSSRPAPVPQAPPPPLQVSRGAQYQPTPRPTIFSSRTFGGAAGIGKQKPSGLGFVSVRASKSTGAITGVRSGRSGSFGRAGGSGSS